MANVGRGGVEQMVDEQQIDQAASGRGRSARVRKSANAFRTISEVSDSLDVPQHVLRFWETKFTQIKPMKRGGGRRYYRPEDILLLRGVRDLLYIDGYTIKGVQKLLREGGVKVLQERAGDPEAAPDTDTEPPGTEALPTPVQTVAEPVSPTANAGAGPRQVLTDVLAELEALKALISQIK
jgi:DNA-binding transcriptional MerR regulator